REGLLHHATDDRERSAGHRISPADDDLLLVRSGGGSRARHGAEGAHRAQQEPSPHCRLPRAPHHRHVQNASPEESHEPRVVVERAYTSPTPPAPSGATIS